MHNLATDQAIDSVMKQRLKPQMVAPHMSEDTDLDEPTSPVNPIAPFPPLTHKTLSSPTKLKPATRASGGRAPEFYGFVAQLVVLLSYILFLLWALLPDKVIHALGIRWYPARCDSIPSSVTVLTLLLSGSGHCYFQHGLLSSSCWHIGAISHWHSMGRPP